LNEAPPALNLSVPIPVVDDPQQEIVENGASAVTVRPVIDVLFKLKHFVRGRFFFETLNDESAHRRTPDYAKVGLFREVRKVAQRELIVVRSKKPGWKRVRSTIGPKCFETVGVADAGVEPRQFGGFEPERRSANDENREHEMVCGEKTRGGHFVFH